MSDICPACDNGEGPCVCPDADRPPPSLVAELLGAAPDHCGGLTVDQYMAWQRDPDYDGPEPNWLAPALRPDAPERTETP